MAKTKVAEAPVVEELEPVVEEIPAGFPVVTNGDTYVKLVEVLNEVVEFKTRNPEVQGVDSVITRLTDAVRMTETINGRNEHDEKDVI